MIPDIEAIVTAYLKAQTGERVVGETPSNLAAPWIKLTQLDASNEQGSRPDHLILYMLQVECYAGENEGESGQSEARALSAEVRAALAEMEGVHDGATVCAVRFAGHAHIPDTTTEPARQRYIITANITAHA